MLWVAVEKTTKNTYTIWMKCCIKTWVWRLCGYCDYDCKKAWSFLMTWWAQINHTIVWTSASLLCPKLYMHVRTHVATTLIYIFKFPNGMEVKSKLHNILAWTSLADDNNFGDKSKNILNCFIFTPWSTNHWLIMARNWILVVPLPGSLHLDRLPPLAIHLVR